MQFAGLSAVTRFSGDAFAATGHGTGTSYRSAAERIQKPAGLSTISCSLQELMSHAAAVQRPAPIRFPEWRENLIRSVAVVALLFATYWIGWRWIFTLNTDPKAIVPSLLLLI